MSHLARGAWIEIGWGLWPWLCSPSHLARGAWIEIGSAVVETVSAKGRTSQEVRGLKSWLTAEEWSRILSHLARGAWIEMAISAIPPSGSLVAPRKRCVD